MNKKSRKYQHHWHIGLTLFLISTLNLAGTAPIAAQENQPDWLPFEKALEEAGEQNKWIMVDVWAPWCGWCLKMQKEVYPSLPGTLTRQFTLTKLNYDERSDTFNYQNREVSAAVLARMFNIQTVPAIVFLSPDGEYRFHLTGFVKTEPLQAVLADIYAQNQHTLQSR